MTTDNRESTNHIEYVGIIGYGEVGRAFARMLGNTDASVIVLNRSPERLRADLSDSPVAVADSHEDLVERADLVLSCVWPATAITVAEQAAAGLSPNQAYLDLNSISPSTTEQIVNIVGEAGAIPLKATIMGSAATGGRDVRLVLAGERRHAVADFLRAAGFTVEDAGNDPVHPAALKMFRSMFTKGLRELAAETLAPAAAYGLHEEVLDDLSGLFDDRPVDEWIRGALEGTPEHAERRLGELREVRATIDDSGFRAPALEETITLHERLAESSICDEDYLAVLAALDEHLTSEDA